ncbi:MAG: hypothetical protein COT74_02710 [Bdellovibrionales bacterium CG10_big_fil_rev_8_21_14_0_10_45_34]|nr:MAG: hypothetical protein COT74_02710 [Bdellovibrionales bacterium CG10_big_fil_rev_8_21_14_0_10_45_34]
MAKKKTAKKVGTGASAKTTSKSAGSSSSKSKKMGSAKAQAGKAKLSKVSPKAVSARPADKKSLRVSAKKITLEKLSNAPEAADSQKRLIQKAVEIKEGARIKTVAAPKKRISQKKKVTRKDIVDHSWEELSEATRDMEHIAYSVDRTFQKGDVISHPSFGVGFVSQTIDGRIDVIFESGKKTLLQARQEVVPIPF